MNISTMILGHDYSINVKEDNSLTIFRGDVFVGHGRWTGYMIEDCSATLDADNEVSASIYDLLDEAISYGILDAY